MKRIFFACGFILVCGFCSSQNSAKNSYVINTIAFYNLENLFDTIDNPLKKDEYSPILQLKTNKSEAYWSKIDNMSRVLSEIGKEKTGKSAAVIGVCEIENSNVLDDILNTSYFKNQPYDYIHQESPDWWGIDVALIYNTTLFSPSDYKSFELKAWNDKGYRVKTRSQLLVSGYLDNELIHLIINHWPSQRSGKDKTAYLRKKSAELTLSILNQIKLEESNSKIIIMGDFNDNPTDESIKKTLGAKPEKKKLKENDLYNPFENMFKKGMGSLGFRDNVNLFDQLILTSNLSINNYKNYQFYKAGIYNPTYLTTKQGRYKGYPFRSFSNNQFTGGYSDHYPVYIYLIREQ
ncbi:MAG: endonuclease/exonuclease/phosphatase family protein [Urechidicola sp.]|nr:endonuclease/exonuclease/phosphatase family protein [Urechidicola sp.]